MSLGVAPEVRTHVYPAIEAPNFIGALTDKVALVTGAGRGIGRAIALALAAAGAHVALLSRTQSELDAVAQAVQTQYHRKALVFPVDVTDGAAVAEAFTQTEKTLGKLDVVVANAATNFWRPFAYSDFEAWWELMEVNTKAPMFLVQLAIRSMKEKGKGTIIVVSSAGAVRNIPGMSAYCSSKAALHRAISCSQMELDAEGMSKICMFTISPGTVKTQLSQDASIVHEDMNKLAPGMKDRIIAFTNEFFNPPELCAQTCVYLASGKADKLRGRYIDAEKDIDSVVRQSDVVRGENLYELTVRELGEQEQDDGSLKARMDAITNI